MAISSEINKLLVDRVFSVYSYAELVMLERVRKRVEKGVTERGWTERKADDVIQLRGELEKVLNSASKLAKVEVSEAILEAYIKGVRSAEKDFSLPKSIFSKLNVPLSIQSLVLEMENLIERTNNAILRNTLDEYRAIQAEAATGILSGVETRKQAAQRMLNLLAAKGIKSFTDKKGRRWDMASYAEMATRTVSNNAALQGHILRQVEAGRDLVLVSSHLGSCPVCAPWGGRVLSISGNNPKYPSLAAARAAGLFHANCRHNITGYIEGLSNEGPHWPYNPNQYEYEQKQRYHERQIRMWKKREVVAMSPVEARKARRKILDYQKAQRELLENYEKEFGVTLRRKYDRESIKNREGKTGIEKSIYIPLGRDKIKPRKQPRPKEEEKEMKEQIFKAFVTDKMTKVRQAITFTAKNKSDAIKQLKGNGYKVDPLYVQEQEVFDYVMDNTNAYKWDWEDAEKAARAKKKKKK